MAAIKGHCSGCSQSIDISVRQRPCDRTLTWSFSYICPFCGIAVEGDDFGFPPDEIRQTIVSQEGEWILVLEDSESKKLVALKILRSALNLSIPQALNLAKRFPAPLARGTQVEMEWLKNLLKAENVRAAVQNG